MLKSFVCGSLSLSLPLCWAHLCAALISISNSELITRAQFASVSAGSWKRCVHAIIISRLASKTINLVFVRRHIEWNMMNSPVLRCWYARTFPRPISLLSSHFLAVSHFANWAFCLRIHRTHFPVAIHLHYCIICRIFRTSPPSRGSFAQPPPPFPKKLGCPNFIQSIACSTERDGNQSFRRCEQKRRWSSKRR